jgi:hypothetical protein
MSVRFRAREHPDPKFCLKNRLTSETQFYWAGEHSEFLELEAHDNGIPQENSCSEGKARGTKPTRWFNRGNQAPTAEHFGWFGRVREGQHGLRAEPAPCPTGTEETRVKSRDSDVSRFLKRSQAESKL